MTDRNATFARIEQKLNEIYDAGTYTSLTQMRINQIRKDLEALKQG